MEAAHQQPFFLDEVARSLGLYRFSFKKSKVRCFNVDLGINMLYVHLSHLICCLNIACKFKKCSFCCLILLSPKIPFRSRPAPI